MELGGKGKGTFGAWLCIIDLLNWYWHASSAVPFLSTLLSSSWLERPVPMISLPFPSPCTKEYHLLWMVLVVVIAMMRSGGNMGRGREVWTIDDMD